MKALITGEQLRRPVPGGIGTYVRGLVRGLRGTGVVPELWVSRCSEEVDPLEALEVPLRVSLLPGRLLTRAWDLGLDAPTDGFDLVHATSLAVPPARRAPMTVFVHDTAWRSVPEAFPLRGRRWHEAALRRATRRAAVLMTPSAASANDLVAGGVDPARVKVVPEGCDHLPPPDHEAAERTLAAAGVDGEFLLAVGTLEPRKNLRRLVSAYERAADRLPDRWPLVIVGPAGWGDALPEARNVVPLGHVGEPVVSALYERCRVFVSVPLLEGYGLPVVEAMHAGAPVVASPVPSAGDAAYRVSPTNVDEIADAIAVVSGDDAVRDDLRERGRRHAATLTWKASAAEHIRIWESLWR